MQDVLRMIEVSTTVDQKLDEICRSRKCSRGEAVEWALGVIEAEKVRHRPEETLIWPCFGRWMNVEIEMTATTDSHQLNRKLTIDVHPGQQIRLSWPKGQADTPEATCKEIDPREASLWYISEPM